MIEMKSGGLALTPAIFLPSFSCATQEELNFLPIWIGVFEAAAIAMELQGTKPPRPMTHDLLKTSIENLGGAINRMVINDIKEGTFYCPIEMETPAGK